MPRKPVDVNNYDRERNGQVEHVSDYTRMQNVSGSENAPAMLPLRRRSSGRSAAPAGPAFRWKSPWESEYTVTAKLVAEGVSFPNDDSGTWHNKFRVTVRSDGGGRTTFDFYGSQNDAEQGKRELTDDDLLGAFKSFLDDSLAGLMSYDDFISEFGYVEGDAKSRRVWRATQRSEEKARSLGFDTEDRLVDSVNTLQNEEERRYQVRRGT